MSDMDPFLAYVLAACDDDDNDDDTGVNEDAGVDDGICF